MCVRVHHRGSRRCFQQVYQSACADLKDAFLWLRYNPQGQPVFLQLLVSAMMLCSSCNLGVQLGFCRVFSLERFIRCIGQYVQIWKWLWLRCL